MIRISKLADYACIVMVDLLQSRIPLSAFELASKTNLSLSAVRKVLKLLKGAHLLEASRGAQGGYRLALPADQISVLKLVEAIDGPLATTDCAHPQKGCDRSPNCRSRAQWLVINTVVHDALQRFTLTDLMRGHP